MNIGVMTVASRGGSAQRPEAVRRTDFGELSEGADRPPIAQGEAIRIARRVLSQPAMAPFVGAELDPGAAIQSDDQLDAWMSKRCSSAFHLSGSCRMGPASSAEAVVGPDLRVHGVQNLRVADASIMPEIVSANTNAASIMIGERASFIMDA